VASAEYTAVFGGTLAGSLAAIATTISRVSGIFERDLGIELVLVDEQDLLVQVQADTPLVSSQGKGCSHLTRCSIFFSSSFLCFYINLIESC
jgi:hypothetical protein